MKAAIGDNSAFVNKVELNESEGKYGVTYCLHA